MFWGRSEYLASPALESIGVRRAFATGNGKAGFGQQLCGGFDR